MCYFFFNIFPPLSFFLIPIHWFFVFLWSVCLFFFFANVSDLFFFLRREISDQYLRIKLLRFFSLSIHVFPCHQKRHKTWSYFSSFVNRARFDVSKLFMNRGPSERGVSGVQGPAKEMLVEDIFESLVGKVGISKLPSKR